MKSLPGLEIGANTHRPHPPADVFDQRFGDCKDKALLLSMILQQEDIPAYVALINTDTRSHLTNVAPSPEAFDHAIVAIRRPDGKYDFIHPTITCQRGPFSQLFIPAYGYGLVFTPKGRQAWRDYARKDQRFFHHRNPGGALL